MARRLAPFLAAWALAQEVEAKWGQAPEGWGDFRFALADDNTQHGVIADGMKSGAQVYGRYRYLNAGVDTTRNWYSYAGPHGGALLQFERNSESIGVSSSYVIYMLQEDGGYDVFTKNIQDPAFMKAFFWNLEWVSKTLAGRKTVFVIEPDTWGYILQHEQGRQGVSEPAEFGKRSATLTARVNDIGYPHLAGLPNTLAGLLQGIVKTFRTFAPDARLGFHVNTWAWIPPTGGDARGMVWWRQDLADRSADVNGHFLKNIFGGAATDLGDFLVVEKYGLDAGYIKSMDASAMGSRYYWTDEGMARWVTWCKRVAQAVDLPILGWQIPIGHMALPNTMNRWQDTFMEYFFAHPQDFLDAGFIGLWVGKGLGQGTDYSAVAGKGDDGRLFAGIKGFDAKRPWILPPNTAVSGASAATSGPSQVARRARGTLAFRGTNEPGARRPAPHGTARASSPWRDARGRSLHILQGTSP
jgi:hypothetical protein